MTRAYDIISPDHLALAQSYASSRRKDAQQLLDNWIAGDGFEDLLDEIHGGGDLQAYCDARFLRIGKVMRYIKDDVERTKAYSDALVGSADRLMNETVKIADDVPIAQLHMNKAGMQIQARARLAKTRAVGYSNTVRNEITGRDGTDLPPIYLTFVPTGANAGAKPPISDGDPA